MHFYQQRTSCFNISILVVVLAATAACTPFNQSNSDAEPVINPITEPSAEPKTESSDAPADELSNDTAAEKISAILGTQADGWLPKVLAGKGLKKGLTPDDVGAIFPGAEEVSEFGFSKVTIDNVPGLKEYEFYYTQDGSGNPTQLESVKLIFDPALNEAYPDLVKILSDKYGAVSPEDVEKEILVWVGPNFVTAQLTKQVADFGSYELNVSLEEE